MAPLLFSLYQVFLTLMYGWLWHFWVFVAIVAHMDTDILSCFCFTLNIYIYELKLVQYILTCTSRCSLGDITNSDACYEKALEVSNDRSARAKVTDLCCL